MVYLHTGVANSDPFVKVVLLVFFIITYDFSLL